MVILISKFSPNILFKIVVYIICKFNTIITFIRQYRQLPTIRIVVQCEIRTLVLNYTSTI